MPSLHQLNVSLTPELDDFVRGRVQTGRYVTSSEVVREGLRLLQQREQQADEAMAIIKQKLQRASEKADRNEWVDGDAFFEQLLARLRSGKTE